METITTIMRCPRCLSPLERESAGLDAKFICSDANCLYGSREAAFPTVDGQPVLIDFEQSLFDRAAFAEARPPAPPGGATLGSAIKQRLRRFKNRLLRGTNSSAIAMADRFLKEIKTIAGDAGRPPRILVIGGGTVGSGSEALYADPDVEVVGTDVFASSLTVLVSDGHCLPFADASFDGVWIQAVLEHVLEPSVVVAQIHRVLRSDGVVFADTPFMQQVHMGAFDFTRFTLSGHRWLFRRFEQIEAGISGGPGIATIWSIRYLARALGFGSSLAGAIAAPLFWLRLLDHFTRSRAGADAACGVFFLGRRSMAALHPKDMPHYYESYLGKAGAGHE